jgi:hypothetical protein
MPLQWGYPHNKPYQTNPVYLTSLLRYALIHPVGHESERRTMAADLEEIVSVAIEAPPEISQRLWSRASGGLVQLLEAHDFARDAGCNTWDFALGIDELQVAGLLSSDFRWLICKGLIEHASETAPGDGACRRFRKGHRLRFRKDSCFVLTIDGVAFVTWMLHHGQRDGSRRPSWANLRERGGGRSRMPSEPPLLPAVPVWDRDRQELRLGDVVVKQFKVPAANQERILAAFEEEGWPIRIDDPLPPVFDQDPKARLHDTIVSLNRNQKHPLLRFYGDGTGQGVRWGRVASPKSCRASRSANGEVKPKAR